MLNETPNYDYHHPILVNHTKEHPTKSPYIYHSGSVCPPIEITYTNNCYKKNKITTVDTWYFYRVF